jgi:GTPase involved in cell partitioning and DNA repair
VLLILIDTLAEDPARDLATLRRELREYNEELTRKPAFVAMSRADLAADGPSASDPPPFALDGATWCGSISGATGAGTTALLELLWKALTAADAPSPEGPGLTSPAEA